MEIFSWRACWIFMFVAYDVVIRTIVLFLNEDQPDLHSYSIQCGRNLNCLVGLVTLLSSALKVLRVLLIRRLGKSVDSPQVGGQELVSVGESVESCSDEVTLSLGVTGCASVHVLNTCESDHLL